MAIENVFCSYDEVRIRRNKCTGNVKRKVCFGWLSEPNAGLEFPAVFIVGVKLENKFLILWELISSIMNDVPFGTR